MSSEFLDYYKKEEQKRAMTEEERFALHKKQKAIQAQRFHLDENDEFYDDDTSINEGVRIPNRTVPHKQPPVRQVPVPAPRPVPKPAPQPAPSQPVKPAPITRPTPVKKPAPVEDPFDKIGMPAKTVAEPPVRRRRMEITESMNPALKEAYQMMNNIQSKVEGMFYRYGMSGLEKINDQIEEFFENVINPPKEEPVVEAVKKIVKKKPVRPVSKPTKSITISEDKKQTIKKATPEAIQKRFEDVNNNVDISLLGESLIEQQKESIISEKTNNRLKNIEAQAKLIQERIDQKTSKPEHTEQVEENLIQEELDVVDDENINPALDALNEAMNEPEIVVDEPASEN